MALPHPLTRPQAHQVARPQAHRRLAPRTSLRLLPQLGSIPTKKAKPVAFAVVLSAMLVVGSLILLLINTMLAQDAFVLHGLQQQVSTLTAQEQAVTALTDTESSPDSLAIKATALGMVPGGTPVFLDVNTGKVVGVAEKNVNSALAIR
jgi:hypothetical protein